MSENTTSHVAESENIESESRESESGSACPKSKIVRTASSVKDSQKKKRSSSTKSRQLENKLESLEKNFQGLEHNMVRNLIFYLNFYRKIKIRILVVKPHRELMIMNRITASQWRVDLVLNLVEIRITTIQWSVDLLFL
jgi:hypothetical protein